jgi:hypothetical protein
MTTLHDLNAYVLGLRPARRKKSKTTVPAANGSGDKSMSAMLSKVRALSNGNGHRAFAMARPLNYEIPGDFGVVRQPSSMSCWAASYTMLANWREQTSMPIESRLTSLARKWIDLFNANTGASAEQEAELWASAGIAAEPLSNPTLEGWEGLLRTYGPLMVIIDVDPSSARAMHAVIVTGIHGDGSPGGTTLTVADPARGDKRPVPFTTLIQQYEQGSGRRTASGRFNQIVHWSKDVKFAGARGFAYASVFGSKKDPWPPPSTGSNTGAGPAPWSTYFPFTKGSTYAVELDSLLISWSGSGTVLERTADVIRFTIKMPAKSIPIVGDIPAFDMTVEAVYKKEGKGNIVKVTVDGAVEEDKNAEITSTATKRTVRPKITSLSPAPEWITVAADGRDRVRLSVRIDGMTHDLNFNRKTGSSGMALGVTPWSQSFTFGPGTLFNVDGPLSFDGRGRVHDRTDTVLKFEINMPPASVLGNNIPKLDLILEATYAKEGPGNPMSLTLNGTKYADSNATITTNAKGARRTIVPSISTPDLTVNMIAFGPDGEDEIDLDVTINGTGHDFDLKRIKTSTSQGSKTPAATVATSTPADALKEISTFAGRTSPTTWKLKRADVAARLKDLVGNPDRVDQGGLNLCGPAAFFHLYARRDPVAFVKYAADLFEKGSGSIGSLKVTPKPALVANDYAAAAKRMPGNVTPVAEWMTLSALRSSENVMAPFTGEPDQNFGGITTPNDLEKWMKASGVYKKVTSDAQIGSPKPVSHATGIAFAANKDILLLINANMIQRPSGRSFLDAFPDHYIHLLQPVKVDPKGVELRFWTWGETTPRHEFIDPAVFAANYYGTVIGEL